MTEKRKRRTNAEILADFKKEKSEKEIRAQKPRVRRTNAQIAADKAAELLTKTKHPKIEFKTSMKFYGFELNPGDVIDTADSENYLTTLCFDINNDLVFNKSPEEQQALWGEVRYILR